MENDYNIERFLDDCITFETIQILKLLSHVILIGSSISYLVGALSFLL